MEPAIDGEPSGVLRSKRFVGQHLLTPRQGVAVHINAFNFPAWGFAEKAACAWLAGMPVVTKPATATSLVTEEIIRILAESGVLPDGALQLFVDRHHGMGGERGVFIERRQAHIPLLLHPRPQSVAVIGAGTGNTLGAVLRHPVTRIEAAESLIAPLKSSRG